jgi:ABC-type Mn2+/Zn2+ transport system permease subunit
MVAWGFYKSHLPAWAFIFGAVSFLFNPLIPVYLNKSSWIPIDFISAILFFLAAYSTRRRRN